MRWVLVLFLPAVAFLVFSAMVPGAEPPAYRRVLARWFTRRVVRRPRPAPPDPFEALRVQTRLGELAAEIRALETDSQVFGKAHRLAASRTAYDDLLEDACRMAGVEVRPPHGAAGFALPPEVQLVPCTEAERCRRELELAARGWSW